LADVAKIDQPMRMEGRFLGVMLAPDIKKPVKKKEPKPAEAGDGTTQQEEAQQSVEEQ
jgi:hypothetical protein